MFRGGYVMAVSEKELKSIVENVIAQLGGVDSGKKELGLFDDMNEAIAAAKAAQKVMQKMPMDFREKIISNIRKKTLENAKLLVK